MAKKSDKNASIFQNIKKVFQVLPPPFRWRVIRALGLLFVNSLFEWVGLATLIPLFSLVLQDNFIESNVYLHTLYIKGGFSSHQNFIIVLCGIIFSVILSKNVFSLFTNRNQAKLSFDLYRYFSASLHKYNYEQGFLHFKNHNSNYIVRDIHVLPLYFSTNFLLPIMNLANEVLIISLIVISILLYNPFIILLLLTTIVPVVAIFYNIVKNKIQKIGVEKNHINVELTKSLYQSIHGYSDVKITNKEQYFFSLYQSQLKDMTAVQIRGYLFSNMPAKVVEMGMIMGLIFILLYGLLVWGDKAQLTILLSFFALAAYRTLPSINRMMASLLTLKEYNYVVDTVCKILPSANWTNRYSQESTASLPFNKEIKINNLNFYYDDKVPILSNVSVSIKKGEIIGIIGRSGSGKTTFINILLRFLKEKGGDIFVDDTLLTDENTDSWRHIVGYVQQDVYVLDSSLAENIAFGVAKDKIDYTKLSKVIEQSSLQDLVKQLPQGYNTRIGERGSQLSGGQRQRVGIARALYSDAKLLVFDEATSALDNETEEEITEAIRKLADGDLTMLIIAHRYSTLKYCDSIIELEKGEVKGVFTYQEVLKRIM